MARSISEEELQLKKRARRRLVGAVVLVTAVAVILPMVLDSEPQPVGQPVEIQIPSPEAGEFKPQPPSARRTAPPAPEARAPAVAPEPAPPVQSPAPPARADADQPAPRAGPASEKAPAAKEPPAAPRDAASAPGAFVVQVAALSDPAKAKQLQRQVAAAGLKAYTEVVAVQAGEVTRVRAGPYATREAAERAREQLKKAGLDGRVISR